MVRRSTGDQEHSKDTFISLPFEQNLPRGLMLRLLSFNGLLIVEESGERANVAKLGSRRNWKNGRERGRMWPCVVSRIFLRSPAIADTEPGSTVWQVGPRILV